jgi:hypothetical protein
MSIGEIKKRIERTDSDVPTKLPVEERKERMDRLRVRLPGLEIKGHLEPSHALVDLMVQMLEQGVLKYVPWSSCTCREQEVLGTKKADVGTTIVPLSNGLLKTQKADHLYIADTGDSLKLQNALQRRALAAELAGLCDYSTMQLLNIKSKTTLQKLRDEGKIRFSQPQKKIILYDRDSIDTYLQQHARNTF